MKKILSKINHWVLILLCLFCCFHTWAQETPSKDDPGNKLTTELLKIYKKKQFNGFGVAVVNDQGVLYAKGFGYSNKALESPYTNQTLQNIGSISKTVIGIALLKAQEQGKLDLDDAINDYLPFEINNPYSPSKKITIRNLATHTSSITDTEFYDKKAYVLANAQDGNLPILQQQAEVFQHPEHQETIESLVRKLLTLDGDWYATNNFLNQLPGSRYEYSNIGAALAAYILEQATETAYDKYTIKNVFKPLNMKATGWRFDQIDMEQHSVIYANVKDPLPYYSLVTYPDGGLLTNVEDLSKYLVELINAQNGAGTLLHKDSYKELFTPQLTASHLPQRDTSNPLDDEYNSGIFMGFTPSNLIGHTGSDPGISTYMFFNPQTKLGRILFLNTSLNTKDGVKQYLSIGKALDKYEKSTMDN